MRTLAEIFFRYGADEGSFKIIMAPDTVWIAFVDGSSIWETTRGMILFGSCWDQTIPYKEVREPSFVDFYEG
jgi:hypothetical protein